MPYTIKRFEPTPNPNAVKCVLDRPLDPPVRSYRSRAESPDHRADPLGAALLGLPGVTGLLISGGWITVLKEPSADWDELRAAVRSELARLP